MLTIGVCTWFFWWRIKKEANELMGRHKKEWDEIQKLTPNSKSDKVEQAIDQAVREEFRSDIGVMAFNFLVCFVLDVIIDALIIHSLL